MHTPLKGKTHTTQNEQGTPKDNKAHKSSGEITQENTTRRTEQAVESSPAERQ